MIDDTQRQRLRITETAVYNIIVQGDLTPHWQATFCDMQFTANHVQGTTSMLGHLDQARLHGLLIKIRDLGLPLISVNVMPNSQK